MQTAAKIIEQNNQRLRTAQRRNIGTRGFSSASRNRFPDAGIGDIFTGRVAGNVVNDDMLGGMEFACAVSGAKLVLVLGHTACGAVKGAIDDVVLGSLTGLLARIKPAVAATKFDGERSSKNASYVDAVARTNVGLNVAKISAGEVQSWKHWKRKEASRLLARMDHIANGVVELVG